MKKFYHPLLRSDYLHDTFHVARDVLLGAYLCTNIDGHFCVGKITELEVYMGDIDRASHAWPNKKTDRNKIMFGIGGHAYMYFIYGMYSMFNIVVGPQDRPHAILVRALEPIVGTDIMKQRRGREDIKNLANGPGKLTVAMGLTRAHYGADLTASKHVWISPRTEKPKVAAGTRIGIDYAGPDKDLPWRFIIKDNPHISRKV